MDFIVDHGSIQVLQNTHFLGTEQEGKEMHIIVYLGCKHVFRPSKLLHISL